MKLLEKIDYNKRAIDKTSPFEGHLLHELKAIIVLASLGRAMHWKGTPSQRVKLKYF